MIIVAVLAVSIGVVCLAVGIDVGQQIWVEKRAERKVRCEAEALLYAAIAKRYGECMRSPQTNVFELNVVVAPKKTTHRRQRLSAA